MRIHSTNSGQVKMILLVMSIILLFFINLALGSVSIPLHDVIAILSSEACPELSRRESVDIVAKSIVLHTRLPQALTAMACGAGLSVAGLLMQTVFHNPLAGPSVLGISSAASLGVAFLVLMSGVLGGGLTSTLLSTSTSTLLSTSFSHLGFIGNSAITLAAIIGAMAAMMIIVTMAKYVQGKSTLLVIGVMIGYIASAITGVLKYFSSEEDVRTFVIWGLGSFARVTGGQVYVFCITILVLMPLTLLLSKSLNIMMLGDRYAENLGLNVSRARMMIIAVAGMLTAIVTAYCGPIMFLGLAVPHITRGIFRTSDHLTLIRGTIYSGASLALLCNLISRLPGMEGALPVNSVTALIGAPIALWVLLKRKK